MLLCERRDLKAGGEAPLPRILRVVGGASAGTPLQREGGNTATARRLDAGLDSDPMMTLEQLTEALDMALEAGRIEVARRLLERVRSHR
jgi:hypothetical protein